MIGIPTLDEEKSKGIWLMCEDCLYGCPMDCPKGVAKLCADALGWNFSYPGIKEKY